MSGAYTPWARSFNAASGSITLNAVVVVSGADGADMPAGADVQPLGVCLETPKQSGASFPVQTDGIAKCIASASFAAGSYVAIAGATGKVKSITPATGTVLRYIVGIALTASGANGDVVYVLLKQQAFIGA